MFGPDFSIEQNRQDMSQIVNLLQMEAKKHYVDQEGFFAGVIPTDPVEMNGFLAEMTKNGTVKISSKYVLEPFCGRGIPSFLFAAYGAEVVGVDINLKAIRSAQSLKAEIAIKRVSSEINLKNPNFIVGDFFTPNTVKMDIYDIWYAYPLTQHTYNLLNVFTNKAKSGAVLIVNGFTNDALENINRFQEKNRGLQIISNSKGQNSHFIVLVKT